MHVAAHTGQGREALIEAGYVCFAELGYAGATTARICARAGVGSGTFFHFFPTKVALLIEILRQSLAETEARTRELTELADRDATAALDAWLDNLARDAGDPHLAGFIAALGALPPEPAITELLHSEAAATHALLTTVVTSGQQQSRWRTDATAYDLATWIGIVADGVLVRVSEDPEFSLSRGQLGEVITRLLT